jgi:hypothetical protein
MVGGWLGERYSARNPKLHELLITAQVVICRSGDYLHCEANGDAQFAMAGSDRWATPDSAPLDASGGGSLEVAVESEGPTRH